MHKNAHQLVKVLGVRLSRTLLLLWLLAQLRARIIVILVTANEVFKTLV